MPQTAKTLAARQLQLPFPLPLLLPLALVWVMWRTMNSLRRLTPCGATLPLQPVLVLVLPQPYCLRLATGTGAVPPTARWGGTQARCMAATAASALVLPAATPLRLQERLAAEAELLERDWGRERADRTSTRPATCRSMRSLLLPPLLWLRKGLQLQWEVEVAHTRPLLLQQWVRLLSAHLPDAVTPMRLSVVAAVVVAGC